MAKVSDCADYRKPDGSDVKREFDVTYFPDVTTTRPKLGLQPDEHDRRLLH